MIIGKKDKEKIKALEQDNKRLSEFERWHQNMVNEVDVTLLNILKAILYQFDGEIIVDQKDIEKASKGEIYMTRDVLRFAQKINLVFKENKLKEWKKER